MVKDRSFPGRVSVSEQATYTRKGGPFFIPREKSGLVRTFHWEDWTDLRFAEPTSERYRRGVARLAERLVQANRDAEKTDVAAIALRQLDSAEETDESGVAGFIDQMASAEEALPKLASIKTSITEDVRLIGQLMERATAAILKGDKSNKGFAARLVIARRLANQLTQPAERILASGNAYASQIHEVDQGFRLLIERAATEATQDLDAKGQVCEFFSLLRSLSAAAHTSLAGAQGMIDAIAPIERMSRDLRPVLRQLRQGLTTMVEAGNVSDEWVQLIDDSGLDCENLG